MAALGPAALRAFGIERDALVDRTPGRRCPSRRHSVFGTQDDRSSAEFRELWLRLGHGVFISGRFHRVGKVGRDLWQQASYNRSSGSTARPPR